MPITRETRPYEILVRFNPDGFQGAHVIDFDLFLEDGKHVGTPTIGQARAITQAEVGDILGSQNALLIEAAQAARDEKAEAVSARSAAEARVAVLEAALAQPAPAEG